MLMENLWPLIPLGSPSPISNKSTPILHRGINPPEKQVIGSKKSDATPPDTDQKLLLGVKISCRL